MPAPANTLLIEGSFAELAEELSQYIDNIGKSQTEDGSGLQAELAPALAELRKQEQAEEEPNQAQIEQIYKERQEVLKKLVAASTVLNSAPEKEFTAAYNLLVHLVHQSQSIDFFLPRICQHLSTPVTSSPHNGPSLALSILTTIFNTLPASNQNRYHVFLAILNVIRSTSSAQAFDALTPQLTTQLPKWLASWSLEPDDARDLHIAIADAATDAGDNLLAYTHLLHALESIPPTDASTPESRTLAVRTLTAALTQPSIFDFTPLTAIDAIQSLRRTDATLFELLEIFAADTLDSYEEFLSESNPLESLSPTSSADVLKTKMRLLTLTTLATSTPSRSLPYTTISSSLQIPAEEVEMWVIDTIRAGLIEGKLSQLKGEFLVHRATYRVFGEKQWSEVQGRLMVWRRSLEGVLAVVRGEREKFARDGGVEQVQQGGYSGGGGYGGGFGGGDGRRGQANGYEREDNRGHGNRRGGARGMGGGGGRQQEQREVDFVGGGDP